MGLLDDECGLLVTGKRIDSSILDCGGLSMTMDSLVGVGSGLQETVESA